MNRLERISCDCDRKKHLQKQSYGYVDSLAEGE